MESVPIAGRSNKNKTGGGLGKQGGLEVHSAENGTDEASTVVASTTTLCFVFRYAQQQNTGEGVDNLGAHVLAFSAKKTDWPEQELGTKRFVLNIVIEKS